MDLDFDSESMDGEIHTEESLVKEEPIYDEDSAEATAESGLNLIPLVYTTRLDDMAILHSNTSRLHPREVTATILKESKPTLHTVPNDSYSRSNKITFKTMKAKLNTIYRHKNNNLETSDIELKFPDPLIDADTIKCEVHEDSMDVSSTQVGEDPLIKCEVLDEPISVCKYSELLKLCRPCRVLIPKLFGYEVTRNDSTPRNELIKPVTSKVKIKNLVNITKEHQFVSVDNGSSSDDEPLITLNPNLRSQLESNDSDLMYGVKSKTGDVKVFKPITYNPTMDPNQQKLFMASFRNRILTEGVIKVIDIYSKEYSIYSTDNKGYILEYYKEKDDIAHKNKNALVNINSTFFPVNTCCWVQRDGLMQSLYPKVLLYSSLRFMRNPHKCPPGACRCCCQKEQGIFEKPDLIFTDDANSDVPLPFLNDDIEIQALENEIKSSIIKMNKETRIDAKSILRNLLSNPNTKLPPVRTKGSISLIDKALKYKKPLPRKPVGNRRLLSLKLENSQAGIIVLRNFAADEREIYEFNSDGDLKSYLKLTCFNNTDRPDVKKLLQKTKQVNDVCCWFKRENLITELIASKTLHLSAVKFIRTRHTCTGDECSCCCKPAEPKDVTLTNITFPSRPGYWPDILNKIKAPPKQTTWLDNYTIKPPFPSRPGYWPDILNEIKAPPKQTTRLDNNTIKPPRKRITVTTPALPKHRILPKLLPKIMPVTPKFVVLGMPAPPLVNQHVNPTASFAVTNTTPNTDDDCQFVGVRIAPQLGHETNSTPIEQPNNITNVQDADLSQEVNTLITSILDRFKDVRLTINSDGKVAAALNTPVSSLTTVELKVLANILSYAQSQVNSLGLNTGMSLSNVINFKVGDQQSATGIDPASMYKVFGDNVNINNQSQAAHENQSSNLNECFTKSLYVQNKQYTDSFTSLLSTKLNAEHSNSSVPVIQNVFSLKDQSDVNTENETSSTTVFCRKPGNQSQRPNVPNVNTRKVYEKSKKRTPANTEVAPPATKRIRVVSPTKLGASSVDKINASPVDKINESSVDKINANSVYQPTMQTHALEVDGVRPGVPLLSNNNFRVVSVKPQAQPVTKPRIIRQNNSKTLTPKPSIVVAPLQVESFNDNAEEKLPTMGTPFSVAGGTSTEEAEDIEMLVEPFKIEQVFNEDDNCILGV